MDSLTSKVTIAWLALIVLTLMSVAASSLTLNPGWVLALAILTMMIKGQKIVDVFMGLNQAPRLWRGLLLSYVLLVPALVGIIFKLFQP